MIIISVSKRWYHPRSEVRQHGKNGAKKRWFVFYLDEEWKMHTKRIQWYEVWSTKTGINCEQKLENDIISFLLAFKKWTHL